MIGGRDMTSLKIAIVGGSIAGCAMAALLRRNDCK